MDVYLDSQFNCKYITVDDFNNQSSGNDDFLVFHQNIRSFNRNYDEYSVFLNNLNRDIDVLVFTETWFSGDTQSDIAGYNAHHTCRTHGRGGGVSIYVKSDISAVLVENMSIMSDNLESCSVRISQNNSPALYVVGIYRPPSASIDEFNIALSDKFLSVNGNNQMLLCGDFNIDLIEPNATSNNVMDTFNSFSFYPIVTLPTRVSNVSSSCLDHFWFNQFNIGRVGVFISGITDHYTIFLSLKLNINRKFDIVQFRDHSVCNLESLNSKIPQLYNLYYDAKDNNSSVDDLTQLFVSSLWDIYQECCPLRSKNISVNRLTKPWLTRDILRTVNCKHKLFRRFKCGEVSFNVYNNYKNYVTSLLKSAKYKYYCSVFETCKGNLKRTWENINGLLRGKKVKDDITLLDDEGVEHTDANYVANRFGDYFSTVAYNLERDIPNPVTNPMDYMGPITNNSFYASPSSPDEVIKLIMSFPSKGSHINSIPIFVYKFCAPQLSIIISDLFNNSIVNGVFPSCFKTSIVSPLHKASAKNLEKNFRPISNIPFVSKIFEKLMSTRMNSFITDNNLLCESQFGFREGRSTSDAVLEFVDKTVDSLDNGGYNVAVFVDLRKAFDTVDHGILLRKLERMGFRGVILDWFSSYLSDRKLSVYVNGALSNERPVSIGLPQGAVCSPILFLLYINDMMNSFANINCIQFADDTTLFLTGNDLPIMCTTMSDSLTEVSKWLIANRLSLNIDKTKYIIFSQKFIPFNNDTVVCINGVPLERVRCFNFLGINIDDQLNFKSHISNVCTRLARSLGILYKMSHVVPPYILLTLYYSLFYSHLTYGILIWGRSGIVNVGRVKVIHGRARRLLYSIFGEAGLELELLQTDNIVNYFIILKMFKSITLKNHIHFVHKFIDLLPNHHHITRFSHSYQYNIPHYNKAIAHKFFLYQAIKIYNILPINLKLINNINSFKFQLKQFLLNNSLL